MFLYCLWDFFKINILKNSFKNTITVSNSLEPDQARPFVGPDLAQTVFNGYREKMASAEFSCYIFVLSLNHFEVDSALSVRYH